MALEIRAHTIEERYGMPVFVEARTLPELPEHPSRIVDEGVPEGKRLRAGAAKVDVTPSGVITMRGFRTRKSTGVHDRLHVKALVLDDGDHPMAILSWEKLNAYDLPKGYDEMARIREEIHERTGIPTSNILINCTHTHSGTEGPFAEASVQAVTQAWENRRDARIGIGSKMIYGIGSSRRLPDGTGLWGSQQPNPDGVMDNECGVIRVEDDRRNLIAVVVNYTSHPSILDGANTFLSGDYAGFGMAEIERRLGGDAVALFLQGCAGDTGTHTFRTGRTMPEVERLGGRLADEAIQILEHIDVVSSVPLRAKNRMITLPQWEPEKPEPGVTMPTISEDRIPAEIQALVIGDDLILVVGPMEPYVEIGLEIKAASKFRHTFTLGYSNGPWSGYLPSNWGYSVNDPDVKGTRFAPDAPDVLVKECLRLQAEV